MQVCRQPGSPYRAVWAARTTIPDVKKSVLYRGAGTAVIVLIIAHSTGDMHICSMMGTDGMSCHGCALPDSKASVKS